MDLQTHKQLFGKTVNYSVNPADAANGVVGYTASVHTCDVTGKQTNCLYLTPSGQVRAAYDQSAANQMP